MKNLDVVEAMIKVAKQHVKGMSVEEAYGKLLTSVDEAPFDVDRLHTARERLEGEKS